MAEEFFGVFLGLFFPPQNYVSSWKGSAIYHQMEISCFCSFPSQERTDDNENIPQQIQNPRPILTAN